MAVRDGASQEQLRQELHKIIDEKEIKEVKVFFGMIVTGEYENFEIDKLKALINTLKIEEYTYKPEQKKLYLTFDYVGNMDIIMNDEVN